MVTKLNDGHTYSDDLCRHFAGMLYAHLRQKTDAIPYWWGKDINGKPCFCVAYKDHTFKVTIEDG